MVRAPLSHPIQKPSATHRVINPLRKNPFQDFKTVAPCYKSFMSIARNPVGWFEIYVSDLERAQAFYEATFETTLNELPAPEAEGAPPVKMLAFPTSEDEFLPGAPGAICQMEGVEPKTGGTLVYFSCADCAHNAALAEAAGGKILAPKFAIGDHGFISMVEDSEGNTIGLHSSE